MLQANESQGTQEVVLDPLHFFLIQFFYLRFNVNSKLSLLHQPAAFSILHYRDIEIHTVDWYILDLGFLNLLQASPHTPIPNFHDHNWQSSLLWAIDYSTLLKSTHVKKARHEEHAFCLVFLFFSFPFYLTLRSYDVTAYPEGKLGLKITRLFIAIKTDSNWMIPTTGRDSSALMGAFITEALSASTTVML